MQKPPLALSAAVIDPDGREALWWSGDRHPYNRPQGLRFGTKRGDGFADESCTLPRRIDMDWPDGRILDGVVLVGDEGSIAYEGRVTGNPRSTEGGHSMSFPAAGYMAEAKRRKIQEVFIDQDVSRWQTAALARRADLVVANFPTGHYSVDTDGGGLSFRGEAGQQVPNTSETELWYVAPNGVKIAKLGYVGTEQNIGNVEAAALHNSPDDRLNGATSTALTLDGALHTPSIATPQRFNMLRAWATATHTPGAGAPFGRIFSRLALYGDHGLTLHPALQSGEPAGPVVSDMVRYIGGKYVPKLSMAGVQDTTYPVRQAAFLERIFPYDAWLELNKWHLWSLSVWENRTLHYGPVDMTDYDWEVRLSDHGVSTTLQGDTVEDLANGVAVQYTDLRSGRVETLTPDDHSELRDESVENPANRHGDTIWLEYAISIPCTEEDALQFGRAVLAEYNQPKEAGTIKVTGHIRDRAGHWQPVWKVRADDTIAITDFPNSRPRLAVETDYTHDSRELSIAVDSTFRRMDAFFDRVATGIELIR